MLNEAEMLLREERCSDFIYDEEKDLFRFKDGRIAFSRTQADVKLLEERATRRRAPPSGKFSKALGWARKEARALR
jgi:hypothetical protein